VTPKPGPIQTVIEITAEKVSKSVWPRGDPQPARDYPYPKIILLGILSRKSSPTSLWSHAADLTAGQTSVR